MDVDLEGLGVRAQAAEQLENDILQQVTQRRPDNDATCPTLNACPPTQALHGSEQHGEEGMDNADGGQPLQGAASNQANRRLAAVEDEMEAVRAALGLDDAAQEGSGSAKGTTNQDKKKKGTSGSSVTEGIRGKDQMSAGRAGSAAKRVGAVVPAGPTAVSLKSEPPVDPGVTGPSIKPEEWMSSTSPQDRVLGGGAEASATDVGTGGGALHLALLQGRLRELEKERDSIQVCRPPSAHEPHHCYRTGSLLHP